MACKSGFGVTLPSLAGGFPVRVRDSRFFLQQGDLFEIGPTDLLASDVHVCICDAQYLRNNISWDDKYRGVRCRSKQHGVWALLTKQFWLGLSRLNAGGILIFRFGWRDPGPEDPATVWYKRQTLRLFTLLRDLFEEVRDVKSDYFNALQSSFYVCCSNFDREKFVSREVGKLLGNNFNYLVTTEIEDSNDLEILAPVDKIRTPEVDEQLSEMLDRINKLRLINEESRKRHQQTEARRDDPRAILHLDPLPESLGDQELHEALSKFGRVKRVDRVGSKASVQFAFVDQAKSAAAALGGGADILGANVRVSLNDNEDGWSREWTAQQDRSWQAAPATTPPGYGKGNGRSRGGANGYGGASDGAASASGRGRWVPKSAHEDDSGDPDAARRTSNHYGGRGRGKGGKGKSGGCTKGGKAKGKG
eukprot:TRINITY_DN20766_c0_g1_i2.p1 TRINITY_DN20766_c0_g1~~TRINITY_DN20766_c0_g1_i2.p1  ORF type:complete len:420 (-),score=108.72 TRINITY_DN20766_c0_g1_i2:82-1341(-)